MKDALSKHPTFQARLKKGKGGVQRMNLNVYSVLNRRGLGEHRHESQLFDARLKITLKFYMGPLPNSRR